MENKEPKPEAAKVQEGKEPTEPHNDEKHSAPNSEESSGEGNDVIIKVEDLHKAFSGKKILDGLTISVRKAQNLVVMGKSGTGKSVLIKCIVRLIIPDSGKIEVLGKDMDQMSQREMENMRLRIGFLFQSGALYDSMNLKENLAFPLERQDNKLSTKERDDRIKEVLTSVGLENAMDKMPSELSGGMRKRAGLARTLILRPEIMLYDEPTTGLDTATSHEIADLINKVRDEYKVASIIITHDLPCAETCGDNIMVLKEGKNGAEGTYQDMIDSKDPFIHSLFH